MDKKKVIKETEKFAKSKLKDGESGHDWWHTFRVWQLAKKIAKKEKADLFIVEISALLHDVFDYKFTDGKQSENEIPGSLKKIGLDEKSVVHVADIINNISFKGLEHKNRLKTIEGKIVHDADKLDAIGAIGIARALIYGEYIKRPLHDPHIKPVYHISGNRYKNYKSTSINQFYEKLLHLRNRMFTKTAKKMAKNRHRTMEKYLKEFFAEWEGKR